jgi:hypothetical protein
VDNQFIADMLYLHTAGGAFGQDVLDWRFIQGVFQACGNLG